MDDVDIWIDPEWIGKKDKEYVSDIVHDYLAEKYDTPVSYSWGIHISTFVPSSPPRGGEDD
jgi:hypothetical protein